MASSRDTVAASMRAPADAERSGAAQVGAPERRGLEEVTRAVAAEVGAELGADRDRLDGAVVATPGGLQPARAIAAAPAAASSSSRPAAASDSHIVNCST